MKEKTLRRKMGLLESLLEGGWCIEEISILPCMLHELTLCNLLSLTSYKIKRGTLIYYSQKGQNFTLNWSLTSYKIKRGILIYYSQKGQNFTLNCRDGFLWFFLVLCGLCPRAWLSHSHWIIVLTIMGLLGNPAQMLFYKNYLYIYIYIYIYIYWIILM